jgi:hypothetical protein
MEELFPALGNSVDSNQPCVVGGVLESSADALDAASRSQWEALAADKKLGTGANAKGCSKSDQKKNGQPRCEQR